jgi:hypothetical protein
MYKIKLISLFKEIRFQLEIREIFKEIVLNATIQEKYSIKDEEGEENGVNLSKMNVLYVWIPIPDRLEPQQHESFISNYLQLLSDIMMQSDLIGLLKTDALAFKNEDSYYFLIKYYRPFPLKVLFYSLIELSILSLLFSYFIKKSDIIFNILKTLINHLFL